MAGDFHLDGLKFRGINGGPEHAHFSEAISFSIDCKDQSEVDYYWDSLVDGGQESMCGWLKDKFGLCWQIVPTRLYELVSDPDPVRARAATEAMFGMRKIVIADLEAAATPGPQPPRRLPTCGLLELGMDHGQGGAVRRSIRSRPR